ncbi:MAG: BrnT family toxin [Magnetococcales bacterium]|nr:BrnT family toxin [Magnetococcales bacterium]
MKIIYDSMARQNNIDKHGIDFIVVFEFDFENAITRIDNRQNYCMDRFIAYGNIGNCLHVLVYTIREEDAIRVISLRKAIKMEIKKINRISTHISLEKKDEAITKAAYVDSGNQPLTDKEMSQMRPMRDVHPNLFNCK